MTDDQLENVRDYRDSLWNSMVSEMRGMLSELEEPHLDEPLRNELTLVSKNGFISIWLVPETGDGSWNQLLPIDECEPWLMSPTGNCEIYGQTMTVTDAAKWFVHRLKANNL